MPPLTQISVMFRPAPKIDDFQLPFEPNAKGFSNWVNELTFADSYASCWKLFCAVQKINALPLKADAQITLLETIVAHSALFADRLEESFLDSGFPLSEQEQKSSEVLVWLYAELSRGFFQTIDHIEGWNRKKHAARALFHAMQALSNALLHISEVYAKPYPGYWLSCYQVFAKAEQLKVLDREVNDDSKQARTLQEAFNHLLTFELCGSNQFRPRKIKRIHTFLGSVAKHAKVVSEFDPKYIKSYCKFNLTVDAPPSRITEKNAEPLPADRYITTVVVAKKIYHYLQDNAASQRAPNTIIHNMYLKIINTLGMAQQRKHVRIKKRQPCTGILGFEKLVALLLKEKTANTQPTAVPRQLADDGHALHFIEDFDPRISGKWEAPELDLVPIGEEDAHQMRETYKRNIWHSEQLDKIFSVYQETEDNKRIWDFPVKKTAPAVVPEPTNLLHNFEILDSSIQGRKVSCLSEHINVKTGDVIGIAADVAGRIELGLICRVDNAGHENTNLGVMLLSLQTKLALMRLPGRKEPTAWALFLPATKSIHPTDSLVFNTTQFRPGDIISMHLDNKDLLCQLGKSINATPAVTHVELIYLREE